MPTDEEKDGATAVLTKEDQEEIDHEKAVNEDPGAEPLPPTKEELKPEPEAKAEDAEPEVKAEADEFDSEILSIAADFGVTEEKARAFSTSADLERALLAMPAPQETPTDTESSRVWAKKEEVKEEIAKLRLEAGEDLDPELVKKFNAVLDDQDKRHGSKAEALEQTIQQMQEAMTAQSTRLFYKELDEMFVKHGEGYATELGQGSTLAMIGKHRANRDKVEQEMGVIVSAHQLRGRPIPSDDDLVTRAIATVFGERKAKDNGDVEKRQRQFLRRGSSRAPGAPSKRTQARMELREKLDALRAGDE